MTNKLDGSLDLLGYGPNYRLIWSSFSKIVINILDIQYMTGLELKPGLEGYKDRKIYIKGHEDKPFITEPYSNLVREILIAFKQSPNAFVFRDQSALAFGHISVLKTGGGSHDSYLYLRNKVTPIVISRTNHREIFEKVFNNV